MSERAAELRQMLAVIEQEARYTRGYTGYSRFSDEVMAAMAAVPRHRFVPEEMQPFAYDNGPLPIGQGQTISQPYIVALMTQLLQVDKGSCVLEIGTGSGYQCAVLAQLVREVYSIEIVEPLGLAARTLFDTLGYRNITTRIGDGHEGWPEHAPYDGIIVTAAAREIPLALLEQLKPGARLVIPVGGGFGQELLCITREESGEFLERKVLPVAFVPLTHR